MDFIPCESLAEENGEEKKNEVAETAQDLVLCVLDVCCLLGQIGTVQCICIIFFCLTRTHRQTHTTNNKKTERKKKKAEPCRQFHPSLAANVLYVQ